MDFAHMDWCFGLTLIGSHEMDAAAVSEENIEAAALVTMGRRDDGLVDFYISRGGTEGGNGRSQQLRPRCWPALVMVAK